MATVVSIFTGVVALGVAILTQIEVLGIPLIIWESVLMIANIIIRLLFKPSGGAS